MTTKELTILKRIILDLIESTQKLSLTYLEKNDAIAFSHTRGELFILTWLIGYLENIEN